MERLDFTLPDFTRRLWVSTAAETTWGDRLARVTRAWSEIEWLSVAAGLRPCALVSVGPEEFVAQARQWVRRGLSALPVEIHGASSYTYASTPVPLELGQPFQFRIVLGNPADVSAFQDAWDASDDEAIGRLLGFPACCFDFYRDVWVEQGMVDTTWPMARNTPGAVEECRCLEVAGPPEANILWRWMGARAVPHLPCSFQCAATVELGRKLIAVGREAGYGAEMDWLLEILAWPAEWSALHGIAEIKTPVLKVSTRTDATARKYVVRRPGAGYPAEGAAGLGFPHARPRATPLTRSALFQRGLDNPIRIQGQEPDAPDWYATDNGFRTLAAQEAAHAPVVRRALSLLEGRAGNVLDLGCGNGALLKKICNAREGIIPYGVELAPDRVEHARLLQPAFATHLAAGDLFETDALWPEGRRYALAILMPGRLVEAAPERAAWLRERLARHCDGLLLYAYGDWLTRYGSLDRLADEAGLVLVDADADGHTALGRVR
jgi:hypothetical protein